MRGIPFFILVVFGFLSLRAQNGLSSNDNTNSILRNDKPLIDSVAYENWPSVSNAIISNDGKYTYYQIKSKNKSINYNILKECKGNWEMKIIDNGDFQFTADSRLAIFTSNDTLFAIKLGDTYITKIPNVTYVQVPPKVSGGWIGYGTNSRNEFVLKNMYSGVTKTYDSIKYFSFSEDGNSLLLETEKREDSIVIQSLFKISLSNEKEIIVWKGNSMEKVLSNSSATKFVFLISDKHSYAKSIWYKNEFSEPVLLINNRLPGIDSSFILDDLSNLSSDGRLIFFTIKKNEEKIKTQTNPTTLTVWSYLDGKLQPDQLKELGNVPFFMSVIDTKDHHITRLEQENDRILSSSADENVHLLQHLSGKGDEEEWKWNSSAQHSYLVRSISKRIEVKLKISGRHVIYLSPGGKFVLYYENENYFSYEISSGITRNISSELTGVSWLESYREDMLNLPRGIAGWLYNDTGILIYDRFDIWLIDPLGKKKPINITNGYGKKENTVFNIGLSRDYKESFLSKDTLILNAINLDSKKNGFFEKPIGKLGDPIQLTMGNYIYQFINNPYVADGGCYPIKAKYEKSYIIYRMSATESPNYFHTNDFRTFTAISSIYPEKLFNWYTTELHSWKKKDGRILQGVLYKPDNFDPNKKYPVILHYYEKKSFALNEYLAPKVISGHCNIDIPTFVSNGYLVFTPDIEYVVGDPMQGTYDAVVSAAEYLTKLSFIDSKKMGIGGCSFGGIQTNYLVTHTNLFAAAYSASSLSDFISAYGDVPAGYKSLHAFFEAGQMRMGASLWQITDKYIKNSAIMNADKVSTPLLLMHTTHDGVCSFSQAVEFFTALRRLRKRAWLLEYSDGNHGVYGRSAEDFGIRLKQFFDHYLKDKPAAKWMTHGIPASMKGMNSEYELDLENITPEIKDK